MFRRLWNRLTLIFKGMESRSASSRWVSPSLIRGDQCVREGAEPKYPIPCTMCNMICQDESIRFGSLLEAGMVYIKDGNLVQEHHLPSCPSVFGD
jgi:hypothetical protein